MATEWIQVTQPIDPREYIRCGAWLDFKTLTFYDWCVEHGDWQVKRNPRTLGYRVMEEGEYGKVALFVEREVGGFASA